MADEDLYFAEAKLGIECETFMASDIGRFFIGRAENEIEAAQSLLEQCDPENAKEVRALQNRIWRARSITDWLQEAINNGHMAEEQLRNNNS